MMFLLLNVNIFILIILIMQLN